MKNKLRVVTILVLVAVLMLQIFASAASIYGRQKKSIFLVMDDSASMIGIPNSDANYSLQTLIAMTDKNDDVKIYFLNDKSALGKIDMSKKSDSYISKIKGDYPAASGGTPYESVNVAKKEIESTASKGDETDYWLVIFTDGEFNEAVNGGFDVNADLQAFAQLELANGTKPNVLFISSGTASPIHSNNLPNLYSVSNSSVIDSMNEAASIISGRAKVKNPVYSSGNATVEFELPYPAKNIIVFTQDKKIKIVGSSSSVPLNTSENYTVSYPDNNRNLKDSTVCFVTVAEGTSISPGKISLTFDKAVIPKDTTILYEPAIGIVAHYYNQDGQEIDPQNLGVGGSAKVKYTLCDSETKQPLPDSMFGGKVSYSADINGKHYDTNEIEFKVDAEQVDITMSATLPDGHVMSISKVYTDLQEYRNINFSLSNGGKFSADFSELKDAQGINANILLNGKPLTPEQFKEFKIKVKGENVIASNFSIKKDEATSSFVIQPKKGLVAVFTPENKTYEVVLTDKKTGAKYTADLTVDIPGARPWLSLLIFILCILIVLWEIFVLVTKTWFPRGRTFEVYYDHRPLPGTDETPELISFGRLFWNEFKAKPFTFIGRFLYQLVKPFASQCVTLYGIGTDDSEGLYSPITISAKDSASLHIHDTTIRKKESGGYESDYTLYAADVRTELGHSHRLNIGNAQNYTFRLNQVLKKETKDSKGYESTVYLKFTDKKK